MEFDSSRRIFLKDTLKYSVGLSIGLINKSIGYSKNDFKIESSLESVKSEKFSPIYVNPKFKTKIVSRSERLMSDGHLVPNDPDGMCVFSNNNGGYILLRNHEISLKEGYKKNKHKFAYDSGAHGGVTRLELDANLNTISERLVLTGTLENCNGGKTPWGSWITCEESTKIPTNKNGLEKKHGYAFEIYQDDLINYPKPLKNLGRFNREAIGIDSQTGFIYQTEDRDDSCLYRFRPNHYGNLHSEGILEALRIRGHHRLDTSSFFKKEKIEVDWVQADQADFDEDILRYHCQEKGAAIFNRGEGLVIDNDAAYFTCTTGGKHKLGQIFKLNFLTNELELAYHAEPGKGIIMPDNLTMGKNGDLFICEDGKGRVNRVIQLNIRGEATTLLETKDSEFSGLCFSRDYSILFVNHMGNGETFAVFGEWE